MTGKDKDPLDKFMVDKIEITKREEELDKEIDELKDKIFELNNERQGLLKNIPKSSDKRIKQLESERETLKRLLRENKQKQIEEGVKMRKERKSLIQEDSKLVKNRQDKDLLNVEIDKLMKEKFKEHEKAKVWKDGKLVSKKKEVEK